jgi:nitrite reductase/ring-hydroxylating ferredoxin subunit
MTASLVPDTRKGRRSVVRIPKAWYVACMSKQLKRGPMARVVLGVPIVLFRARDGTPGALLDRCPHRNVPLSEGRVVDDNVQCAYHGWEFDCSGVCRKVPGLTSEPEARGRNAPSFAVREQDGFVWVWAEPDDEPTEDPYKLPIGDGRGYTIVRRMVEFPGSLHATLENALDVPHTAFLHRGLFRGNAEPNDIRCVVTRDAYGVQAEYLDEPRPPGLAARILSPSGGTVTHYDRFRLPNIAEVEYRLGDESHFVAISLCTPLSDFVTRVFAVVAFKLPLPGWLVAPFIGPVAMRVFKQDVRILALQTEAIERFGGEQFVSTEIDVLGGQIWRLLRRASEGKAPDPEEALFRRELTLRV